MISLGFALACLAGAVALVRYVPTLRAWPPSLGLLVAVLTVVPPHQTIAVGIGADDVLFVIGLALLVPYVRLEAVTRLPYARWLLSGAGLLVAGMTVSAFVNTETLAGTASMLVRGPGRVVLYVVAVIVVFGQLPHERTRHVVARALAGVGSLEAVVGVAAYVVAGVRGEPGFGLEPARGNTTLLGLVPGRVTGTLELSSNFLGALLTLAIPVTVGLVLDARGRARIGWGVAALTQVVALVLTFTRSSLALTLLACAVLLALRARLRWLIGGAALVLVLLVATPAGERFVSDNTDRAALWSSAIRVFLDHPIAGVGPGEQATFTAAHPARYRATDFGVAGNNAHNTVLLAGAEDGILGLMGAITLNVAFVLIAVSLIRRIRRRDDARTHAEPLAVAVAVLAFLLQGMVNNLFTVTLTATALVMLVAGCALPWLVDPPPGERAGPEATGTETSGTETTGTETTDAGRQAEPRDTPIPSSSEI